MSTDLYWLPPHQDWKSELAGLASVAHAELWKRLVRLANYRIDFIQTIRLERAVEKYFGALPPATIDTRPVKLAVLASSTVNHLLPAIRVGALRRGIWCTTYTNAYGQYLYELLDDKSALTEFQPDAVLLNFDAHHLADSAKRTSASDQAEQSLEAVSNCWRLLSEQFRCTIVQQTLLPVFPPLLGSNEQNLKDSPNAVVMEINSRLRQMAVRAGVHLLAVDQYAAIDGLSAWSDPSLWHRAKQEISPRMAPFYGDLVGRILAAEQGKSYKALVLDLDNTLWGGVIGDDGLSDIQLGQNSAAGEAYVEFQRYVQRLGNRGVVLAICSKNDERVALSPFEQHPEMVLRRSDISCFCANWQDKASNLRLVARSLNIGLDSLVFTDDNPFEREQVRYELPMVAVPELPEDPALYAWTLSMAGYFEALQITTEDRERARHYQANIERDELRHSTSNFGAYLAGLEMTLTHGPFDAINLKRVVQLINKTNQFNVTTKRYSEEQTQAIAADKSFRTHQFRLTDRFGDNGIICVVIGESIKDALRLDTWLMSCRVLGRQVEDAALNVVAAAASQRGLARLIGTYRPSDKNKLVRDLFQRLGFTMLDELADGESIWELPLSGFLPRTTHIQVTEASYATK